MSEMINYSVAYVKSEDEECPTSELLAPGPTCKGWSSAKYCIYPQVNNKIHLFAQIFQLKRHDCSV